MKAPDRHREASSPKRSLIGIGIVGVLFITSCSEPLNPYSDDTPTSGHVLLLADEDLRSLVDAEKYVFESIYTHAVIDVRYLPEAELLKAVMNDSVRCWIGTVQPGGEQQAYYAKRTVEPHVIPICMDGIAVVVNKGKPGDHADLGTIRGYLSQRVIADTVNNRTEYFTTRTIVAGRGSGVARTLIDSLSMDPSRLNATAQATVEEVILQVNRDPNIIGFIPFAAISDLDNPHMRELRDKVKMLPISRTDSSVAVLPSQSTLADGSYPLRRPVFMVLVEGKSGLGTGFVSFVANHKGQRIILKQGLAPQKVPAREVEIVHQ